MELQIPPVYIRRLSPLSDDSRFLVLSVDKLFSTLLHYHFGISSYRLYTPPPRSSDMPNFPLDFARLVLSLLIQIPSIVVRGEREMGPKRRTSHHSSSRRNSTSSLFINLSISLNMSLAFFTRRAKKLECFDFLSFVIF